ncbi:helix-turn-helix transcriptional regulator [bacterium]|nr:helix-turn-helix transcriptional regulator [bacterium]
MKFLSRIEEILLLTIWKLGENAFGISIREQVEKDTGITWMSGAIYAPLQRLKKNKYVDTRHAEGAAELGGRPRIYYSLTSLGEAKLISIQEINQSLWNEVPDFKKEF